MKTNQNERYMCKAISDGKWVKGYYAFLQHGDFIIEKDGSVISVDEETICRATGFRGKNGKMIYEGDILSGYQDEEFRETERRTHVIWENGWYCVEKGEDDIFYFEQDPLEGDFTEKYMKVVGNIYDDRLKKEEEEKTRVEDRLQGYREFLNSAERYALFTKKDVQDMIEQLTDDAAEDRKERAKQNE